MKIHKILLLCVSFIIVSVPVYAALFGGQNKTFTYENTMSVSELRLAESALSGQVTNLSNMPISSAELTVFFMDKNNQVVGQAQFNPLQKAALPIPGMDGGEPLQPQETREFSQDIDVPQGWSEQEGTMEVKITSLEFQTEDQGQQQQQQQMQDEQPTGQEQPMQ